MSITTTDQYPAETDSYKFGRFTIPNAEAIPLRVRDMAALRGLGYSYRLIGQQIGISAQAVSLMLGRYRRRLDSLSDAIELQSLSCRAANALGRHGVSSRHEARAKDVLRLLSLERNCGHKTIQEIERWISEAPAEPAGHVAR